MALPSLFEAIPVPFRASYDPEAPWALLGEPLDLVLGELDDRHPGSVPGPAVHLLGERIIVEPEATVAPGAVIEGPAWIGAGATIRTGAYVRGGCWIGERAVVGANTEIKRSILFPGAKAPHLAYVGDSVVGHGVNLGAGCVLSNFRHDGRQVVIPTAEGPIETGRRKLGAVLGDRVAVGCNCVLHPGVVLGRGSQTYPGVMVRSGVYREGVLLKLRQAVETVGIIRN